MFFGTGHLIEFTFLPSLVALLTALLKLDFPLLLVGRAHRLRDGPKLLLRGEEKSREKMQTTIKAIMKRNLESVLVVGTN